MKKTLVVSSLFKSAGQEEVMRVGRHQLMARRQNRETEKHESANDVGAVGPVFRQGQDDVATLQFLFGVLEQGDESFLRARLHQPGGHLEVQFAAPQDALPAPVSRGGQFEH